MWHGATKENFTSGRGNQRVECTKVYLALGVRREIRREPLLFPTNRGSHASKCWA